ncbi:ABC transporter ATP-binding protein [Seleniivibrio woodruffii]|uniref:iron ABC transporter ATP-binding protein n=1 Tax=Seleniivibrio woodruffii TaxID=1078050 RepID=UPI0026EA905D|nr:ATP-binding cassette domain-containing protein [Seleniivibrio woodruffii]
MMRTENISKFYDEKAVVEGVSVDIPKGKITSFIGSNGAGKSTLLSIMSRLIKQSDGKVYLDGMPITDIEDSELAKRVSILKQSSHINIRLTVRELVSFGRFPYSGGRLTQEDEDIVSRAIGYMDLTESENKYIDTLSGGQRQRAFIAMIIAQDTDCILLDEPLNNLDMKHSVQIMKTLRRLTDELGKTVVLVIHDINFASCYSDYIAALKDGKLAGFGKVEQMIESGILKDIFGMEFDVREMNGSRICLYYT